MVKYTEAWAKIAKDNVNLKVALSLLTVCTVALCYVTVHLSVKDPLILERSCYTRPLETSSNERSANEVKAFVKIALEQRFNHQSFSSKDFLSVTERRLKESEKEAFLSKNIHQRIIVNNVDIKDKEILVDADRILSVGEVRSALAFPLIAHLETQSRSLSNPYGLILIRTEEVKAKKEAKSGN